MSDTDIRKEDVKPPSTHVQLSWRVFYVLIAAGVLCVIITLSVLVGLLLPTKNNHANIVSVYTVNADAMKSDVVGYLNKHSALLPYNFVEDSTATWAHARPGTVAVFIQHIPCRDYEMARDQIKMLRDRTKSVHACVCCGHILCVRWCDSGVGGTHF